MGFLMLCRFSLVRRSDALSATGEYGFLHVWSGYAHFEVLIVVGLGLYMLSIGSAFRVRAAFRPP
jgi:hypothetical protein